MKTKLLLSLICTISSLSVLGQNYTPPFPVWYWNSPFGQATYNLVWGPSVMSSVTDSQQPIYGNLILGCSGDQYGTGSGNTLIGQQVGTSLYAGSNNVAIGLEAMQHSTNQNNSVAIGYQSMLYNASPYANTAIGYATLKSNCTNTTAIGYQAGNGYTNSSSVFVGDLAGANAGAYSCVSVGVAAGQYMQGAGSVAVGYGALQKAYNGSQIGIGYSASMVNTGADTIAIGYYAFQNSTNGVGNLAIGDYIGSSGLGSQRGSYQDVYCGFLGNTAGPAANAPAILNNAWTVGHYANAQYSNTFQVGTSPGNGIHYPMQFASMGGIQFQMDTNFWPTAKTVGGTVGYATNHWLGAVNAQLWHFWSDGTTLYSNAITPP